MPLYFLPFLCSFLITIGIVLFILFLCRKFNFLRSWKGELIGGKKIKVCRMGGVAVIIGFLGALLLDTDLFISQNLWGIIIVSVAIIFLGVYDDFFDLDWKTQLLFQISIALLVFIMGVRMEYITNPLGGILFLNLGKYLFPSLIFTVIWIVLIVNSMNWIDGIDGLSGGVSLIGAITVFFLSLKPEVNQPPVGIIAMALSGALLGFLVFNFYPSKILAGTSGSMFMGFILAALAIFAGAKIATALLVMAVPVIDAIWVIGERIKSGDSIFKSDKRHLHYKLSELGWSQQKIALLFYSVTIFISFIALNTRAIGKFFTIISVIFLMILFLVSVNKKLKNSKSSALRI